VPSWALRVSVVDDGELPPLPTRSLKPLFIKLVLPGAAKVLVEPTEVIVQGAIVRITDADGNQLDNYTSAGTGFLPRPIGGELGLGAYENHVDLISGRRPARRIFRHETPCFVREGLWLYV